MTDFLSTKGIHFSGGVVSVNDGGEREGTGQVRQHVSHQSLVDNDNGFATVSGIHLCLCSSSCPGCKGMIQTRIFCNLSQIWFKVDLRTYTYYERSRVSFDGWPDSAGHSQDEGRLPRCEWVSWNVVMVKEMYPIPQRADPSSGGPTGTTSTDPTSPSSASSAPGISSDSISQPEISSPTSYVSLRHWKDRLDSSYS